MGFPHTIPRNAADIGFITAASWSALPHRTRHLWSVRTMCLGVPVQLSYGRRKESQCAPFSVLSLTIHPPLTFQNLIWVDDLHFNYCYLHINCFILAWLKECKMEVGWVSAALTGCLPTCSDVAQSKPSWKERWKEELITGESKSIKKTGISYSY